jgi:hypothetical protein
MPLDLKNALSSKKVGVHVHVDPHTKKVGDQDPGAPTGSPPMRAPLVAVELWNWMFWPEVLLTTVHENTLQSLISIFAFT